MSLDAFIGIAVVGGALALALIGLALRMMRMEREAQPKKAGDLPADLSAPPPPPPATPIQPAQTTSGPSAAPAPAPDDGVMEVLRVLHDPRAGLVVEISGTRYTHVSQISDSRRQRVLAGVVNALQQFAQGQMGQASAPIVTPAAPPAPQESPAASVPAAIAPAEPEEEPLQLPSMNPVKQMQILRERQAKKAREQAEARPQSIVEQIEALLVKRLLGSPFDGRSIHMRPGLRGGAHIDVDGKAYQSVEDVPDPELRAFIKGVVAEWERENDPATRRSRV